MTKGLITNQERITKVLSTFKSYPGKTAVSVPIYVFEDINNHGQKEKKGKEIADVAVSNGTDIVLKDSEDKYNLPIGNGCLFTPTV